MKKFLVPLLLSAVPLLPIFFAGSCANTTQAPSGGIKDTIPPVLVNIVPLPGTVNVPVKGTKITFTFDEFVTVKNPNNIYLSPPLEKKPKNRIVGKNLIITFEEDLLPDRTYTLSLTDAVADVNESNMFPGFTYAFSTGPALDSMYITGTVRDCKTMLPFKDATVLLYKDQSDSAVFLQRPFMSARTDDWGFFSIPYIQDTVFRIYAIKDESANNIYDPDTDLVAFSDSLVKPVNVVRDTIYELMKFDMKDTAECLARKSGYELKLFREKPSKQYIMNKARTADRSAYVTFMAPYAWIDSLWIGGLGAEKLITQFNLTQDSLEIWVNDSRTMPDTLHLFVNYRKTDSLGHLLPEIEHLRMFQENKKPSYSRRDIKHEDTTCVLTLKADPERVEQYGFELEFKYPIVTAHWDSVKFTYINPKQKEFKGKYTIERDSLNLRKFVIRPEISFKKGFEYSIQVNSRAFRDINGYYSDSTNVKVSLPSDDELSKLTLNVSGVDRKLIVDLMNEKMSEVIRTYITESDAKLQFPYLKAAKYSVRITDDGNRNSIVDTGSLLEHRQPELVCLVKFNNSNTLDIPKSSEIEQNINFQDVLKSNR